MICKQELPVKLNSKEDVVSITQHLMLVFIIIYQEEYSNNGSECLFLMSDCNDLKLYTIDSHSNAFKYVKYYYPEINKAIYFIKNPIQNQDMIGWTKKEYALKYFPCFAYIRNEILEDCELKFSGSEWKCSDIYNVCISSMKSLPAKYLDCFINASYSKSLEIEFDPIMKQLLEIQDTLKKHVSKEDESIVEGLYAAFYRLRKVIYNEKKHLERAEFRISSETNRRIAVEKMYDVVIREFKILKDENVSYYWETQKFKREIEELKKNSNPSKNDIEKHLNDILEYKRIGNSPLKLEKLHIRMSKDSDNNKRHVDLYGEIYFESDIDKITSGKTIKAVIYNDKGNIELESTHYISSSFSGFDTFSIGWVNGSDNWWNGLTKILVFIV